MKGRRLVSAIMLADGGVFDVRRHRSLRTTVWRMVGEGVLVRVHRGVYVEAAADAATRLRAACVWQPDGVVAGRHGVAILRNEMVPPGIPELICPRRQRPQCGLRVRTGLVDPHLTVRSGRIRVAAPAYLAVEAAAYDGGNLMDELMRRGLAHPDEFREAMGAFRRRPGAAVRHQRVCEAPARPFSTAERELHRLLRRARLTEWVANVAMRVNGRSYVPDVRFTEAKLIIEVDGRGYHSDVASFENDRQRQNEFVADGWVVLRFTWAMLTRDSDGVIDVVRRTLQQVGATGG